ncbi:MAG: hypothetical protein IRY94_13600 [Rhodospirillaceae bacterium]|nr:hypothetical protein [Rhodospirillaceae bacterium]
MPPRRMLAPAQRHEVVAMASAYLRELGVDDADRRLGVALRLVERVENLPPTRREDVMLLAFEELQRLIGEAAGSAAAALGQPETAEFAGRLGLYLAGGADRQPAEAVLPLAGPVAPALTMAPQPLDTWLERVRAVGQWFLRVLTAGPGADKAAVTVRIER